MQSRVRFNRVPKKVLEKVWEALVQSQVRFSRVPEKVPEKVPGGFAAEPGQVQQGSEEGSGEGLGGFGAARPGSPGEGLGGFGAEPGQIQQGSGEDSGKGSRKPWCKARSGSTGSGEGSGEGLGGFGAEPGQAQRRFRRRFLV